MPTSITKGVSVVKLILW